MRADAGAKKDAIVGCPAIPASLELPSAFPPDAARPLPFFAMVARALDD